MNNIMLKYAKYVVFFLIMTGSFSSCEKKDDNPEKFRLVKILYFNKSTSTTPTDGVEYLYDEAGNMVKESYIKYIPTTVLYMYKEYEYWGNKKIKMKLFDEDNEGLKLSKCIDYIYVNDQLVSEEISNGFGSFLCSMNYEYKGSNMIREYYYEPDYGISAEVKYTFDSQNRLIIEENDGTDNIGYIYIKYIYDSNERLMKLEYCDQNWELIRSIEKIYNGRSKLPVKDLHYDKNGIQTSQYEHYYDKKGNLTETRLVDGCSLFKRKYNGGLLMEEILYHGKERGCAEDETTRYEYEKI